MDWRHLAQVLAAGLDAYTEFKNLCVWAKNTAGMGSFYRSAHELVFVFKNGHARHRNNVQLGEFGRNRTNVWHYPGAVGLRTSDEGNLLAIHPTVKPVRLIADAIMDASCRGDIVLDSFLGSGTTVIAAERTGRRCYGLEIDPLYADTVVRRWQTYTGGSARHLPTNRTFEQIESEREVAPMSLDKKRNYQVGYAKPPRKTRFEKGTSGNPAGRVKGSKNVSKLLLQALSEQVVVNENGERKRITKGEAMIKQLVNKGASGDARSIQLLLAEMRSRLESELAPDQTSQETKGSIADAGASHGRGAH